MDAAGLAEFLRARRDGLRLTDVGLPATGRSRRTPGLRREEVAALAGMSVSYYERLEQARGPHPSPQVLGALARALRLTDAERVHLFRLAGEAPLPAAAISQTVAPTVRALLDRIGPVPAYVRNARHDVLAWNDLAATLLVDFAALPAAERNVARLAVHPGLRHCSAPDGQAHRFTDHTAAHLRASTARHPGDLELRRLVADLVAASPAFETSWARHDVRPLPTLRKQVTHPELGSLELDCQTLTVPGEQLYVVLFTAEPGSAAAHALARLAETTRRVPRIVGAEPG